MRPQVFRPACCSAPLTPATQGSEAAFRVDVIVTPEEVIQVPDARRGPGILWHHLADDKVAQIPALAAQRPR